MSEDLISPPLLTPLFGRSCSSVRNSLNIRPRSHRLQNGYCHHTLLSWKRFITVLMWIWGAHTYQPVLQHMVSPHRFHPGWKHRIPELCRIHKQLSIFWYPHLRERERIHMYNSALIHCQIALFWTMRVLACIHSVLICVSLHGWGECCLIMTARRAGKIILFPWSRKVDLMHFNCNHIYTP